MWQRLWVNKGPVIDMKKQTNWIVLTAIVAVAVVGKTVMHNFSIPSKWEFGALLSYFVFSIIIIASRTFWTSVRYWGAIAILWCVHAVFFGCFVHFVTQISFDTSGYLFIGVAFAEMIAFAWLIHRMTRWFHQDAFRRK